MASAHIGTSGFTYKHWREVFYPEGVPQKKWLEFYAQNFETVELNNTFYAMPRENTCTSWAARTGRNFLFAVKLNRILTHRWRLMHPEELLERYLQAVGCLGSKLGPILVQLPPKWRADPQRLDGFLDVAPSQYRWCLEFRDPAWLCDEVYQVLRKHNAALVIHDLIPDHPRELTADWTYLRFHGTSGHDGNYDVQQIKAMAKDVAGYVSKGLDTFAYFNNDLYGYAVKNAMALKEMLQ